MPTFETEKHAYDCTVYQVAETICTPVVTVSYVGHAVARLFWMTTFIRILSALMGLFAT